MRRLAVANGPNIFQMLLVSIIRCSNSSTSFIHFILFLSIRTLFFRCLHFPPCRYTRLCVMFTVTRSLVPICFNCWSTGLFGAHSVQQTKHHALNRPETSNRMNMSKLSKNVQSNLTKCRITTPYSGELTRMLCALAAGEQCAVPAADECKNSFTSILYLQSRFTVSLHWVGTMPVNIASSRGGSVPRLTQWFIERMRDYNSNFISISSAVFAQPTVVPSPTHGHIETSLHATSVYQLAVSMHCVQAMQPNNIRKT